MNNQTLRLLRLPEVLNKTGYGRAGFIALSVKGAFLSLLKQEADPLLLLKVKLMRGSSPSLTAHVSMQPESGVFYEKCQLRLQKGSGIQGSTSTT